MLGNSLAMSYYVIAHVLLANFNSFHFVLGNHLWPRDRLYYKIHNHVRNEMLFSFIPTRSNNGVMEGF